jgi:hypothetical protein
MKRRENLTGADLAAHTAAVAAEEAARAQTRDREERKRRLRDAQEGGESDSSSDEEGGAGRGGGAADEAQQPMQDVTNATTPGGEGSRRYGDFYDAEVVGAATGGFDIYVRRAPTRRFPFVERRAKVDAYGEVIDVGGWLARGKAVQERVDRAAQLALGKRKREEEEEVRPRLQGAPTFRLNRGTGGQGGVGATASLRDRDEEGRASMQRRCARYGGTRGRARAANLCPAHEPAQTGACTSVICEGGILTLTRRSCLARTRKPWQTSAITALPIRT